MNEHTSGPPLTSSNIGREQLDLPFDQYQRYRVISDALGLLRENEEPLRILDVGGAEGVILKFLHKDDVTILDQTEAEGVPGFVLGDATALPFEDESFDYVVSVDVYEHIPDEVREKYLSELRRVARGGVLLAAPFDSEAVRAGERFANEFHRSIHNQGNVWLEEHADNGLPDLDGCARYFETQGDEVTVLPNGYLPHWLAMISLTFYGNHLPEGMRDVAGRLNNFYNEFMYEHDNVEPGYRHAVIALKSSGDADLSGLASSSDHPDAAMSAALFSTFSSTLSFAPQVKDLSNKLAEKEAQIRDLSRRLAQQTAVSNSLTALRQENAKMKRQLDAITNSRAWQLVERQRNLRISLRDRLGKGG